MIRPPPPASDSIHRHARSLRPARLDDRPTNQARRDGDADGADAGRQHRADDRDRGETEPDNADPACQPRERSRKPDPGVRSPEADAPGEVPVTSHDRSAPDSRGVPRCDRERPDPGRENRGGLGSGGDRPRLGFEHPRPCERGCDRECGTDEKCSPAHAGRADGTPVIDPQPRALGMACGRDDVSDECDGDDRGLRDGEH